MAYETQLSQLRQSGEDDQKQIAHLIAENEKLANTNIERLKEIDALRTQRVQLEERLRNETNDLRAQLEAAKANSYVISKQIPSKADPLIIGREIP